MGGPTIARINVTPVKSTALTHPERVQVRSYGVEGNRVFYFATEDGLLWGGSKHGPLARIRSAYDPATELLRLELPDGSSLSAGTGSLGDPITVDYYGRPVPSHVVDGPWSDALEPFAGCRVLLLRADYPGGANDVEPITVASLASVEQISSAGGASELDARRFRMTFDLEGCAPYEEDTWEGRQVRVGGALLEMHGQVPRCVVTTQDPNTGERDFPTLSLIRSTRGVNAEGKLPFGVYARVLEPGQVSVGDALEVL